MSDDLVEWHTVQTVRAAWSDANNLGDLSDVLTLAKRAVWRYVPRSTRAREVPADWPDLDEPPALVDVRYRVAQLMHVQSLVQVRRTSPAGDSMGLDGYQARVYVFGAEVRKVLVPPTHGEIAF